MFSQLSFFLLVLALSCGVLGYKSLQRHLPWLSVSWWSYGTSMVVLAVAAWMFIYQDDWHEPLVLFVCYYAFFMLVRRKLLPLWCGVVLTLVPLVMFKAFLASTISILGISFATFRAVDALLMHRKEDSADFTEYFLYVFFPPALLAGPMYRWRTFREDIAGAYGRMSVVTVLEGWEYMVLGIVQKFAIAQVVDVCVLQRVSTTEYSLDSIAANAIGYSVFLYFDFAGYSNMAIGAAGMFGFRLPDNFRNPIATRNPQDFWRRWHVSLSEWLRDVVFSPLYKYLVSKGGMANYKLQAQNICIFVTLMIMGTWNGLELKYVCSGMLFGMYSVVYNCLCHSTRTRPALKPFFESAVIRFAGRILTLLLEVLALYVFSGRSAIQ